MGLKALRQARLNEDTGPDPVTQALAGWSPTNPAAEAPAKPRTTLEQVGRDIELRRKTGSTGTAIFLFFWISMWTVGCIALAVQALHAPTAEHILFAIPFWVGEVIAGLATLNCLFGREHLRLSANGLEYERRVVVTLKRRQAAIEDVRGITGFATAKDSDTGRQQYGIKVLTLGEPVRFGKGLTPEELIWLADALQRQLYDLSLRIRTAVDSEVSQAPSTAIAPAEGQVEVLKPSRPARDRPEDAQWNLHRDFNHTEVTCRPSASGSYQRLFAITFFVLFWNGLVGGFAYQVYKEFQWCLFLFLIPFELVGAVGVGLWIATLFLPFTRKAYTVTPSEISASSTLFGIGRTRRHELARLDRLELRKTPSKRLVRGSGEDEQADRIFSLALVDAGGRDLLQIDQLTEGETRWIADELFDDFRNWHVRVGA